MLSPSRKLTIKLSSTLLNLIPNSHHYQELVFFLLVSKTVDQNSFSADYMAEQIFSGPVAAGGVKTPW